MVNFNFSEFRGYHGRWAPGGEHHPHLRRRRGLLGSAVHAAESVGVRDTERAVRTSERDVARTRRATDAGIRRTAERMASAQGIPRTELTRAERAAGLGTGRGAEKEAKTEAERAKRDTRSAAHRRYGRYHPLLRHALVGRHGAGLLRGLALARMLRSQKSTAASKKIGIPSAGAAKAKAKAKAPAKKKAAAKPKKAAAAKRPVTIKPPKAPTGKRAGTGKGKGVAQKVTPSAQVMANLRGYTLAPGGARAGVGTAGRSSMSSTGTTAGSRVGGAGRSLAVGRRG